MTGRAEEIRTGLGIGALGYRPTEGLRVEPVEGLPPDGVTELLERCARTLGVREIDQLRLRAPSVSVHGGRLAAPEVQVAAAPELAQPQPLSNRQR
jgi:hypothetical protein